MAQLDPDRYKRLTSGGVTYAQSDGIYWDGTNSLIVVVVNDAIVASFDATSGQILVGDGSAMGSVAVSGDASLSSAGAVTVSDLTIASEARGDILRRNASAWGRLSAKTSGQILVGDGTDIVSVAVSGASLAADGTLSDVARATLAQDDAEEYVLDLFDARVHDAPVTFLPNAAANDDMGLVEGTFGTDSPSLQGVDFGGTATDEECRFFFKLPPEYVDGETITLRVRAGILTTVADAALTLDAEVYLNDGDGAVGSDICATAAQSINSLTLANKDFTITPTGVVAGDELDINLTFAGSDVGDLGEMVPIITKVSLLLDIKG